MGDSRQIRGHVQSIAMGIADRDRSTGANLLPNVNPTFNWVRLAQRIPVRVQIDEVPKGVRLVAGQTATVAVDASCASVLSVHCRWPWRWPDAPPAADRKSAAEGEGA